MTGSKRCASVVTRDLGIFRLKQSKLCKAAIDGNQSNENAGVAFVKGADERNKFFEKISNQ